MLENTGSQSDTSSIHFQLLSSAFIKKPASVCVGIYNMKIKLYYEESLQAQEQSRLDKYEFNGLRQSFMSF